MKLKKATRFIALFICIIVAVSTYEGPAIAAINPSVSYNGKVIQFTEVSGFPYVDKKNRTLVPFRKTLEFAGATVSWNQKKQTATAVKDGVRIDVPIGQSYIYRNNVKIMNDTKATILNDRTYLPIRIVLESLGCTVVWNAEISRVVVTYEEAGNLFTRIPPKYDLRTKNKVTSVKNQLDTGACWAFASLGAMESSLMPNQNWDFSEDHLSLGHGYNLSLEEGGNHNMMIGYVTRWAGPVIEKEDPFNDGILNPNATVVKHVQEIQYIPSKDYSGIKVAIMSYGGVESALYVQDLSFNQNTPYYNVDTASYYYTDTSGELKRNHDVVIVGWDDNYPKENFNTQPKRNGAFIAKNSYGTAFGDDGYFYISYEDMTIGRDNLVFTRIDNVNNYDQIYQWDKLGYVKGLGYGQEQAYFANVYETSKPENLSAVSFYATGERTSYEVYVVANYTSENDLTEARMVKKGRFEFPGYYTVDFNTPIRVDGPYAVMVKITTPGAKYPVAAEFKTKEKWTQNVDVSEGLGYISANGKSWVHTETAPNSNAHICLKAFTRDIS